MKNTQAIILKAAFLAAWSVLLLTACGNEFIIGAEAKHNSVFRPSRPGNSPRINWGDNQELYVNPYNYELSGTISGKINRNGYNVWFAEDLSNPDAANRRWEILPPQGAVPPYEGIISPEFLGSAALLGGKPTSSADGEVITLIFHAEKGKVTEDDVYNLGAVPYSFILNPGAFRGADSGRLSANTQTVNFNVNIPSLTNYIKHEIEKYDYGGVDIKWGVHQGNFNSDDVKELLGEENGVLDMATEKFDNIMSASVDGFSGLTNLNFPDMGEEEREGSFLPENAVWVSPPPDMSKGYWFGTSTLRLGAINAAPGEEGNSDPVQISVRLNFRSDVGDAIIAIKTGESQSAFVMLRGTGSETVWEIVDDLLKIIGSNVTYKEKKSSPPLTNSLKRGVYNVDIELMSEEGAPSDTVSIEVIVP